MLNTSANLFITIATSAVTAFLGMVVYVHDRKNATNQIFAVHSLMGALWAIINYLSLTATPDNAIFFIRGVVALAVPHVLLFYVLVNNFPESHLRMRRPSFFSIVALGILMIMLVLSQYGFSGVEIKSGQVVPIAGESMPVFATVMLIFFLLTVFLVARKYRQSAGIDKQQWYFISLGLVSSYALLIVFVFLRVILFQDPAFVPYSPLFILPIFLGSAYAILKHELFNVRLIATEAFIFFIMVLSLAQLIVSQGTLAFYLGISTTASILFLGILLIRSVLKEVRQKEELQVLSQELAEANSELKKLDAAKSEFISIASHQLRAPLTVIKGYVSMVLEGIMGRLEDKSKNALTNVFTATNHLIKLVADLLDLSRIESGKIRYEFAQNDLVPIVEEAVRNFRTVAEKKSVKLSFQNLAGDTLRFLFDKDKLREVIINLIDNAIKYSNGEVVARLEKTDNKIRFLVKDNGLGLSGEDKKKMFIKFSRSEGARLVDPGGMGIGLYFVKIVVDDHKGAVGVESEGVNKGSTFWVELPFKISSP